MSESQHRVWDIVIKALGFAAVVVSFAVGVHQYRDTKQKEFYSTFGNRRLELYAEASEATAEIATAPDLEKAARARQRFWQLFYGPMSLVEDDAVKAAMQNFGRELAKVEKQGGDPSVLQQPSYRLAIALRESLRKTWNRPFEFAAETPASSTD